MTDAQKKNMAFFLQGGDEMMDITFHHGDCIGADSDAHDIAESLGLDIVIHPPTDPKKRAFRTGGKVLPKKPYLLRNRHIVRASDLLIATPGGYSELLRSGTWSTIRYARKKNKGIYIIYPDGSVE